MNNEDKVCKAKTKKELMEFLNNPNIPKTEAEHFAKKEINKLNNVIKKLINIKQCADGGTELMSNQGQGLDGYSELANYRQVIEQFVKENLNDQS